MKINIISIIVFAAFLSAETLFQVTDSLNNKVFDISNDGLRVFNLGDTLMVISATAIKANLSNSKGLSRSFSVSTTTSKRKGLTTNVLEVGTDSTSMREGSGARYTRFGPYNTFIGLSSGILTDENDISGGGRNNIFLGNYSGVSNLSGGLNIFIGYQSGNSNQIGSENTYIGTSSGFNNTAGSGNVFIGSGTGSDGTAGSYNTFIGTHAGYKTGTPGNTFVGFESGFTNDTGQSNSYFGQKSGYEGTGGSYNSIFGKEAGYKNKTGTSNSIFGYQAGYGATNNSYSNNCLFGAYSGKVITTGSSNSMYGYSSGYKTTTGLNNVFVGDSTGFNNLTGSGNLFMGSNAGYSETGSNKLYIDNSSTTLPLIYGDFGTDLVKINGNFGVGVAPSASYGINVQDDYIGLRSYVNTTGTDSYGIYGQADNATSQNVGIAGFAYGSGTSTNIGIYGYGNGGSSYWAGYFQGNINVTGSVIKSADKFRIDHPLDSQNKYLNHASVSSDEMKNIYDGIVVLDGNGKAVVVLPDWFETLNSNFRYQMTAIGAPGPDLYISKEVTNNSFEIAGGTPGMKVSWMITGTRNDNYAKANPIHIEEEKSSREKGYYINPESFGLPADKGIKFLIQKDIKTVPNDVER